MAVVLVVVVMEADQEEGGSKFEVRTYPRHFSVTCLHLSTSTRLHVLDPITLLEEPSVELC